MKPRPTPHHRPEPGGVKSCDKCRHISRDGEQAFCRRYPPSLTIQNGASYVPVKLEWLCGEWSKA